MQGEVTAPGRESLNHKHHCQLPLLLPFGCFNPDFNLPTGTVMTFLTTLNTVPQNCQWQFSPFPTAHSVTNAANPMYATGHMVFSYSNLFLLLPVPLHIQTQRILHLMIH